MRRRGARARGQSMVEFALILPIFLLLVFGAVDLGRAVFYQSLLDNAVRDGARLGIVDQDPATVRGRVQTALGPFGGQVTTCAAVIYTPALLPGAPACAMSGSASPSAYGYVTVTAALPFSPLVGLDGAGWHLTLQAQSTMLFFP